MVYLRMWKKIPVIFSVDVARGLGPKSITTRMQHFKSFLLVHINPFTL